MKRLTMVAITRTTFPRVKLYGNQFLRREKLLLSTCRRRGMSTRFNHLNISIHLID